MIWTFLFLVNVMLIAALAAGLLGYHWGRVSGYQAGHTDAWTKAGGPELKPLEPLEQEPGPSFWEEVDALLARKN